MPRHEHKPGLPPTKEERAALAQVIAALTPVDEFGARRVLMTAATFFGIELTMRPQGGTCRGVRSRGAFGQVDLNKLREEIEARREVRSSPAVQRLVEKAIATQREENLAAGERFRDGLRVAVESGMCDPKLVASLGPDVQAELDRVEEEIARRKKTASAVALINPTEEELRGHDKLRTLTNLDAAILGHNEAQRMSQDEERDRLAGFAAAASALQQNQADLGSGPPSSAVS